MRDELVRKAPGDVTRAEAFDVIAIDIAERFSVDTARAVGSGPQGR